MRIAVLASGSGSNFEALVKAGRRRDFGGEISLLVCNKSDAYALERAKKLKVEFNYILPSTFPSRKEYEQALGDLLDFKNIDIILLAGYMLVLGRDFIKRFDGRILNIHPSYLPDLPGLKVIERAFKSERAYTGVTVHEVDAGLDSGPVVIQQKVPIKETDSLASLEARIHALEHSLYPKAVKMFIGRHTAGAVRRKKK